MPRLIAACEDLGPRRLMQFGQIPFSPFHAPATLDLVIARELNDPQLHATTLRKSTPLSARRFAVINSVDDDRGASAQA